MMICTWCGQDVDKLHPLTVNNSQGTSVLACRDCCKDAEHSDDLCPHELRRDECSLCNKPARKMLQSVQRLPGYGPPLSARFPGRCVECGDRIYEGDIICGINGCWVHEECVP